MKNINWNLLLKIFIFSIYLIIIIFNFDRNLLLNNGDYLRITRTLNIDIPIFKPSYSNLFNFQKNVNSNFPKSTLEALAFCVKFFCDILQLKIVNLLYIRIVLYIIFIVGIVFLIFKSQNKIYSIILIPITYVFIDLLNSLYQEASVLAFLPLLLYFLKNKISLPFIFFSFCVLFSKAQLIVLYPLVFLVILISNNQYKIKSYYYIIVSFCLMISFFTQPKENQWPNQYNRYYNGIGWSIQNVENWPRTTFLDRRMYFNDNRFKLQLLSNRFYQKHNSFLAGTDYWSVGNKYALSKLINERNLFTESSTFNFFKILTKNPWLIIKILSSSFKTALKSNYNLKFLIIDNNVRNEKMYNFLTSYFFILFVLLMVLVNFFCKYWFTYFYTFIILFLFPFLVVLGDGYVDFEKHLITYLLLLPFYLKLKILIDNKKRIKVFNNFHL